MLNPDPKTLTDAEVIKHLTFAILTWAGFKTDDDRRFNKALMTEYLDRKLTDYVIDEFLEFIGMSKL